MVTVPETIDPRELAAKMGWSLRRVKAAARGLGACRVMGNRMVLTQADVDAILEASRPCPSSSKSAAKSGTIAGPSPAIDYEALVRLRNAEKLKNTPTRLRRSGSTVVAMASKRP